ncbi:MAG: DUF1365 domain-containing protein [Planctomycetota bacterium]|nr:MAG: DUF1365 domain-containing protein [Planctomycetota bacterium]
MHSAIYEGWIRHRRYRPRPHDFCYPIAMAWLDTAELDRVFSLSSWWRKGLPGLVRFHRRDYLAPYHLPLELAVRQHAQALGASETTGPIRMLTLLRCFGHSFNPVTFYYGYDDKGVRPLWVLAEITNTPWLERHCYLVEINRRPGLSEAFAKRFHVSPFFPLDQTYRWFFSSPEARLAVHMVNRDSEGLCFDATLRLRRRAMSAGAQARTVLRYPLQTIMVVLRIHIQAARLWWKGTPFYRHPRKRGLPHPLPHGATP